MERFSDFRVTVDPATVEEYYPLPRAEELFAKLEGDKLFRKLGLRDAYLQVLVGEEVQKIRVINTHQGLYRLKRMSFA